MVEPIFRFEHLYTSNRLSVDSTCALDRNGNSIEEGDTVTYTMIRTGRTDADVFEGCTVDAICADGRVKILHSHFATGFKVVSPVQLKKTS